MSIVVVESGGCVSVCGRKEEDVSFSEHTTRIGRERVRVHPSQRERGIFGDTSLCTRHLRERHHLIESQRGILRVSPIESTTALFEKKKTKKSCIIRPSYSPL